MYSLKHNFFKETHNKCKIFEVDNIHFHGTRLKAHILSLQLYIFFIASF